MNRSITGIILCACSILLTGWATNSGHFLSAQDKPAEKDTEVFYVTDDEGIRRAEIHIQDGQNHGRFIRWNKDGSVYVDGIWKNGLPFNGTFHDCDLPVDLFAEYLQNKAIISNPVHIRDGIIVTNKL